MDNAPQHLKQLAQRIFAFQQPFFSLLPEAIEFKELVETHASFQLDRITSISSGDSFLESGWAVSPAQAAWCLNEYSRTLAFIQGLEKAIQSASQTIPNRPIRVLYAGCGPFAALALPSMAVHSPDFVQFTLIDIHSISLNSAKELIALLGNADHVTEYVCADAVHYRIPEGQTPDVIVSETMNACLGKEPQVMVMRNLYGQAPHALLVPARVEIEAYLLNLAKEHVLVESNHQGAMPEPERDRIFLQKVFTLDSESIHNWQSTSSAELPAASVTIPPLIDKRYQLRLLTKITTFADIQLKDYDSNLTAPQRVLGKSTLSDSGETLHFYYKQGSMPQLIIKQK